MSYEEAPLDCPRCKEETWHGRDVADVFQARSLAVFSHMITVYNDLIIPWRCLRCGRERRGRAPSGPYLPRTGEDSGPR
jgi:hypothetical protein